MQKWLPESLSTDARYGQLQSMISEDLCLKATNTDDSSAEAKQQHSFAQEFLPSLSDPSNHYLSIHP